MLKFFAFARRLFLAGIISLVIIFFLSAIGYYDLNPYGIEEFGAIYMCFALISPVLGLIFWLISTAYIRKHGQFAAIHQSRSFGESLLEALKQDITSPFRKFAGLFYSKKKLADSYSQVMDPGVAGMLAEGGKTISRSKFLWVLIRSIVYLWGIISAVKYLYLIT